MSSAQRSQAMMMHRQPVEELDVGFVLNGRYRVGRLLAESVMARVYVATDLSLGQPRVLKVAQGRLNCARLEREAELHGKVAEKAPGLVRLCDQGWLRPTDTFFAVFDYLDGQDLSEALRHGGTLAWQDALGIIERVAATLAELHATGIVHRDIKPANIFLCRQGDVRLLDLGVAWAAGYFPLTTPGETVGTQPYLAFEQIAHPEEIDGRADVFALGLVLAEMVAGPKALPWYENLEQEEVLGALQRRPPLHRLAPWLPRALTDVIETACQLDPAGRYQSMNEFRAVLVALLDKEKQRQQRLAKRQRRKRRMLLGAAAVGIYAAGLVTGGLLGELRLQRQMQMRPLAGMPCEGKSATSTREPSQTLPSPTQENPMKNFIRAAGAAAGIMAATGAASRPSTAHAKPKMCQTDADCKKKEACKSAGSLGNWCAERDDNCPPGWRFTKRAADPPKGQCWIDRTPDGSDPGRLY